MRLPVISDRVFGIDVAAVMAISLAIVVAADRVVFMSLWVPAVLVVRLVLLRPVIREAWGFGLGIEVALLALCTLLGGFNDWNSVTRHRIYDYDVPALFPTFTLLPEWMLLYWGLILRSLISLFRWERLAPPAAPRNAVSGFGADAAAMKIGIQLALVLVTRQFIYRFYEDPIVSWLPLAVGIAVYLLLFKPGRYEAKLLAVFLLGGPLIEILYIQFGHLHSYRLGWLAGVPIWIALWWVLGMLTWSDMAARILARVSKRVPIEIKSNVAAQA